MSLVSLTDCIEPGLKERTDLPVNQQASSLSWHAGHTGKGSLPLPRFPNKVHELSSKLKDRRMNPWRTMEFN